MFTSVWQESLKSSSTMKKIKKIIISDSYKPVDMAIYKINDILKFDCYVQRFRNFVVIIQAGTKLSTKDVTLLSKTDRHYIKYSDYKRVFGEETEEKEHEEVMLSCEELDELNNKNDTEKVKILYYSLINHLEKYFLHVSEFNQECLDKYIAIFVSLLSKDIYLFKSLLDEMLHVNRHEVHSTNVAILAMGLGVFLEYPSSQVKRLVKAAMLHDLGKGDVDENIFHKRAKLNSKEFEEMKRHSYYGYIAAQDIGIEDEEILMAILHHHEYLDGSGYPDGLRAQKIPQFTQLITICDMFDAMTSSRDFRDKKTAMESLTIMKKEYKNKLKIQYINDFIRLISKVSST